MKKLGRGKRDVSGFLVKYPYEHSCYLGIYHKKKMCVVFSEGVGSTQINMDTFLSILYRDKIYWVVPETVERILDYKWQEICSEELI